MCTPLYKYPLTIDRITWDRLVLVDFESKFVVLCEDGFTKCRKVCEDCNETYRFSMCRKHKVMAQAKGFIIPEPKK
ncbi:MAG: hypothetical protein Solivirus2_16 [Solivirus sp.]|uniref:Uncharacterized protein n=1 Tax=Solivirus sp. TaxID=2487772 RepID=A0A3G5AFE8_9VIRU|nr:MAG: hypothetical protein Solivirus2_16 [Solivirus sp.]